MSDKKPNRSGLGRGLSALMADVTAAAQPESDKPSATLPVEKIEPNPNQPRRDFEPKALEELAESIKAKGVIQPLIVRPIGDSGRYEIVAGERRWRAAQVAGVHRVPVLIRDYSDEEVLEVAIIENIQRSDLNVVEEAMAFRQLMERFGHSQERLAQSLSRSRSHIANTLRLLSLPDSVLTMLRDGTLTAGHARAVITSAEPLKVAQEVVKKGLSVRETEALVRKLLDRTGGSGKARRKSAEKDADTRAIEADLTANLGMTVRIEHNAASGGGQLSIAYGGLEELDLLCDALSRVRRDLMER